MDPQGQCKAGRLESQVQASRQQLSCTVDCLGFRDYRVQGLGFIEFRVWGIGFRVFKGLGAMRYVLIS